MNALPSVSEWMTRAEAAEHLRLSVDTVDRHRVFWTEAAPQCGKWRYKMVQVGGDKVPRIFRPDVEAAFLTPKTK